MMMSQILNKQNEGTDFTTFPGMTHAIVDINESNSSTCTQGSEALVSSSHVHDEMVHFFPPMKKLAKGKGSKDMVNKSNLHRNRK